MEAVDGTARRSTPPAGATLSPCYLRTQHNRWRRPRRCTENGMKQHCGGEQKNTEKRRGKKAFAKTIISQSSTQEHMPSEKEIPTMDVALPEDHLPDWMSQLFDKLDSEVKEDAACLTVKEAQVDIHQPLERGISSDIHRTLEEKASITDVGLPEEDHLPDWMSQLFDKLDAEVKEDAACSTVKFAQVDIHQPVESGISSDIHRTLEDKDSITDVGLPEDHLPDWMSQLFDKLDAEVKEDAACSTVKVAQVDIHQPVERGISSDMHRTLEDKDSITFAKPALEVNNGNFCTQEHAHPIMDMADIFGLEDDDAFLDWVVDMLKKGGRDDILSQFDLNEAVVCPDVQDESSDLDEGAECSRTSLKRVSNKETLENGIKWMSEECFLAFTESGERNHYVGIEHKFGELRRQCLNIEAYDKIFHHYNFTIEAKYGSDIWSSKSYFAEVKQLCGVKSYFCCPLESTDDGWCYGCQNMKCDLKHPSKGGYEEGNADICWPFIDETDSGSDEDCGFGC